MSQRITIIDNFYPNPKTIAKKVARMEFVEPEDVTGWRTNCGYFPPNIIELIESRSGFRVDYIQKPLGTPHDNGTFFHTFANGKKKEIPGVHWDTPLDQLICIVYLSEGIPAQCGTSFYRHRSTGLESAPFAKEAKRLGYQTQQLRQLLDRQSRQISKFEEIDRVGYRFNRAVIFPAKRLHAATAHYGEDIEKGRIYQIFSFKAAQC